MCYIDGQKNTYSVLNECSRMLKDNTRNNINYFQLYMSRKMFLTPGVRARHVEDHCSNHSEYVQVLHASSRKGPHSALRGGGGKKHLDEHQGQQLAKRRVTGWGPQIPSPERQDVHSSRASGPALVPTKSPCLGERRGAVGLVLLLFLASFGYTHHFFFSRWLNRGEGGSK
jgi:hypothetical protein